jgi:hypothetical protein
MKLLFAGVLIAVLLALLWYPSLMVARTLQRNGNVQAMPSLRTLWPAQLLVAACAFVAVEAAEVANPAGYFVAIGAAVSVGGALALWVWRRAWR